MRLKKLIAILLLLILGFFFWQVRKRPLSVWNGSSRVNLVIASEETVVVSLEPEENLTVLKFPKNLYLDIPHGFGKYQLGSVYELGELEKKGGELLRETIQGYLGVQIDAHIKTSNLKPQTSNIKKNILNFLVLSMLGRGETNFTKWDLARLWWRIKKLRSDKVKFIDLKETNILSENKLPDGSPILETEHFRLDELVRSCCIDHKIYEEGLRIEVLNATDHLGLANRVSRLIANMGGNIIGVGNANTEIPNSKFQIPNEKWKNYYTVKKLEKVLGMKVEVGEMGESRADLLILVGEDYWQKLTPVLTK